MACRLFGQPTGGIGDGLRQAAVVGLPQLLAGLMHACRLVAEGMQGLCRASAEPVPGFLGGSNRFAQATALRLLRCGFGGCLGQNVIELVGALDLAHQIAAALCLRNVVEGIAHQPLGDILRSFEQAANLQVDAGAQLLDVYFGWQGSL